MDPAFGLAIFALGLAFGSFLNVCIYRLPRDLSVVHPGSACPKCAQPIRFYDNVPILSWLSLRGRCRQCKASISPRYLVVELLTGLLFLACYAYFGFTLAALKYCVFGFLLLGLIFSDAETQLLPDKMTLPGLVLGLLFSLVVPVNDLLSKMLFGLIYPPAESASSPWLSLLQALMGAAAGASFIYGAGAIYLRARGVEGMGFGDVKLMAMVGAFLGIRLTIFTLFSASVVGSLAGLSTVLVVWIKRTRRRMLRHHESPSLARRHGWASASIALRRFPMPFGVFLGSMAMVASFFGDQFFPLVLEVAVKVLSNPIVLRLAIMLLVSGFALWMATLLLRRMRRMLTEESYEIDSAPELEQFPVHTYNAVIQQLKQQKHELLSAHQVERRRAKTSENISAAVLSNLSSGVLFLTPNGLVRTANAAAKSILGFASPVGMGVVEIFREARLSSSAGSHEKLAAAVQASLRAPTLQSQSVLQTAAADYVTPAGEPRILEITISPVNAPSGESLGSACLITDKTEFALIQRQQELRGEMSGEMALALRNSLATISSYAQQLAVTRDLVLVRQLAADIGSEAAELDHTIGGFLAGASAAKAAGA